MPSRRSLAPQEVPEEFAALLHRLRDDDDPLLNPLLAVARDRGWRAPTLASALSTPDRPMNPPAVSKRVERARRLIQQDYDPVRLRELAQMPVPQAPQPRARAAGRRLPEADVQQLRQWRQSASKVNGATPADAEARRDSERLSAELHRLITQEGFTACYLAQELGLTHRAVTSRLERHHFRKPCPSVAGTPSGEYHRRKIGDPGRGVRRLPQAEREELRRLWRTQDELVWTDEVRRHAASELRAAMRGYLTDGYTLANLAQAMKARTGALRAFLDAAREGGSA